MTKNDYLEVSVDPLVDGPVTIQHGKGNILLQDGQDMVLSADRYLRLVQTKVCSECFEVVETTCPAHPEAGTISRLVEIDRGYLPKINIVDGAITL